MWMQEFLRRNFHKKILSQDLIVSQRSFLKTALFSDFKHQDVLWFFLVSPLFYCCWNSKSISSQIQVGFPAAMILKFHLPFSSPCFANGFPKDFPIISQTPTIIIPPLKRLPFARCLAFDSIQTTGFSEPKGEDFVVERRWVGLGGRGTCSNRFL